MKAELVPDNGDPPIRFTRDVTGVGRGGYCDVVIDHPSLSKRHCVLVKTDGLLVVRDLASTNGTKVKGQKIRWAALLPDDRLTLGSCKFRVYLGPDDTPGPSDLGRWGGSTRKGAGAADGARSASADDRGGRDGDRFPPPSPLETPAVKAGDSWPSLGDDSSDSSDSSWRERLRTVTGADAADVDADDVIIELE